MKKSSFVFMVFSLLFSLVHVGNADTLFIPHFAFVPDIDEADFSKTESSLLNWYSPNRYYLAPLNLPQGAVINGVFLFYEDNSADYIQCYIIRVNPDTGSYCYQFPITTATFTPGIQHEACWRVTAGTRIINHNVFTYSVCLMFSGAGAGLRVHGVRIHYNIP